MTMNNEEYKSTENNDTIKDNDKVVLEETTDEEVTQFYQENKEAIDLIGGFDMLESILNLSEENLILLKPQFLSLFATSLNEENTIKELRVISITQEYTTENLEKEFETMQKTIDTIDFLSETKKDFLKEILLLVYNKLQEIIETPIVTVGIPCQIEDGVQLPTYAHKTDAGLDIYAKEEITIAPGETKIIGTGIKVAIPDGYAILIQPRSGQSVKTKLRIANTPGLIDAGYRDEIGVIIENIEPPFKDIDYEFDNKGEIHIKSILHGQSYTIAEGQRFAQMRLVKVPKINFMQIESINEIGEDRGGGFGSSGK